jgi:hypothetical protein
MRDEKVLKKRVLHSKNLHSDDVFVNVVVALLPRPIKVAVVLLVGADEEERPSNTLVMIFKSTMFCTTSSQVHNPSLESGVKHAAPSVLSYKD